MFLITTYPFTFIHTQVFPNTFYLWYCIIMWHVYLNGNNIWSNEKHFIRFVRSQNKVAGFHVKWRLWRLASGLNRQFCVPLIKKDKISSVYFTWKLGKTKLWKKEERSSFLSSLKPAAASEGDCTAGLVPSERTKKGHTRELSASLPK